MEATFLLNKDTQHGLQVWDSFLWPLRNGRTKGGFTPPSLPGPALPRTQPDVSLAGGREEKDTEGESLKVRGKVGLFSPKP